MCGKNPEAITANAKALTHNKSYDTKYSLSAMAISGSDLTALDQLAKPMDFSAAMFDVKDDVRKDMVKHLAIAQFLN